MRPFIGLLWLTGAAPCLTFMHMRLALPCAERRKHGVDVSEVLAVVRQCTGLMLEAPFVKPPAGQWQLNVNFDFKQGDSRTQHPCSVCFREGQAAVIKFAVNSLGGSVYTPGGNNVSQANIELACSPSLARQWTNACGAQDPDCSSKGEAFWGPLLGPATNLEHLLVEEGFHAD